MLSRVADGLFWISRYIERAENLARIADVYLLDDLDRAHGREADWSAILQASGAQDDFARSGLTPSAHAVTDFLTYDEKNPNSITACLDRSRENARMIRDQLTTEMWEELNRAWLKLCGSSGKLLRRNGLTGYFREVRRASHLFRGTTASTLSRGDAADFLELGMYLERADATSRILEAQSLRKDQIGEEERWAALLRSCSAREAYRTNHQGPLEVGGVLAFLIHDPSFPRSLHYGLVQTGKIATRLAQPRDQVEVEALVLAIRARLTRAPLNEGAGPTLAQFLDSWQKELQSLADWMRERIIGGKLDLPERSAWRSQQEQQQQNFGGPLPWI